MKYIISIIVAFLVFSSNAQSIEITSPNGGEFYNANTSQTITWNVSGSVPPMDLYYTTDNGVSWSLYATGINAAAESYIWTVPNDPSNVCLIRFEAGAIADTSDAVFSINFNNNAIVLTSPNGGEIYSGGSSQTVTWTNTGPVGSLEMFYSIDNGASWVSYASGINAFSGSFSWTVPNVTSTQCLVRLTDGIASDESNAVFTINGVATGSISVLQPNGGESLIPGTNYNILWTTAGTVGLVDVLYSIDNGNNWSLITSGEGGTSYTWLVPNAPSGNCLIRITDGVLADQSDATFTIEPDPTTITLTTPNGGEVLQGFDTFQITWDTTSNGYIDSVDISFKEGTSFSPHFITVANNGSYNWLVPNVSTTQAKIDVKLQGYLVNDSSDATFTINPIALELANPNGGEILYGGDGYEINWYQQGVFSGVDISVSLDSGATYSTIATNVLDTFYVWTVPNIDTVNCIVKLDYQGIISDTSDAVFSIHSPEMVLVNPNGGETILGGDNYQINWSQLGDFSGVDISVSLDSGVTYSSIATNVLDTFYVWTVPNIDTLNCVIKLDYQGLIIDTSDAVFAIEHVDFSSVSNENETNVFRVFPNPSEGVFHISGNFDLLDVVNVLDINGKVILEYQNVNEIDLTGYNAGVYLIQYVDNSAGGVLKVVLK